MKRAFLILTVCLLLPSCVSVSIGKPKPRMDVAVLDKAAATGPVSMGKISSSPPQLLNSLNGSMEEVLIGAANRAGMAVKPSSSAGPEDLRLNVHVGQKSFMRGFDEYSSITVILTIKKADKAVAQLVYTKDSDTSLDSFATLYDILGVVMPALSRKIPALGK